MRLRHAWFASTLLLFPLISSGGPAEPTGYERDIRSYNLARGRVMFTNNCMKCHEKGVNDAPVIGDLDDWTPRIQQPLSTLIDNALGGHCESPPQGDLELQDRDVAVAVAYVVHRSRLLAGDVNALPATGAGPSRDATFHTTGGVGAGSATPMVADNAVVNMLLMVLGKDRWK